MLFAAKDVEESLSYSVIEVDLEKADELLGLSNVCGV